MRRSGLLLLVLMTSTDAAAQSASVVTEHVRAELVAHAPQGVAPGADVWVGLAIEHAPHWHTYWKNPGDSGLPTSLAWQLPAGVSAQDIAWPTPQALKVGPLVNYGYEGKLLLPVPLRIEPGFAGATLPVRLHAEWLVCEKICIPEAGDFALELPVATPTVAQAARFANALARAPRQASAVRASVDVAEGESLTIRLDGLPPGFQSQSLQFLPELGGVIDHAAPITQQTDGARWQARVRLAAQQSERPAMLAAVLLAPGQDAGLRVNLPIDWSAPAAVNSAPPAPVATTSPAPPFLAGLGPWLWPGIVALGLLLAWFLHKPRQ